MEDIPDALLGKIMVLADYGAAAGEPTCPAARFACVSQRWNRVYSRAHFETNELKRIASWSIQDLSEMRDGSQGSVETIVDSWVQPLGHLSPNWWTSACVFSTNGREWLGDPVRDAQGGPFGVRPGHAIPHLRITFQEPVSVRAIALEARNRPRLLWLRSDQGTELLAEIPPPSPLDRPERGLSRVDLPTEEYMELVAQELPQGSPPSPVALFGNSAIPVVLSRPVQCQGALDICILESHEVGWVGINRMALLE